MNRTLSAFCLLVLTLGATGVMAQINPYKDGTPGVTGYRSEVLAEVMIQEDKFTRLAEAIPADKFNWRPSPDVRSFAEVFFTSVPPISTSTSWSERRRPQGSI